MSKNILMFSCALAPIALSAQTDQKPNIVIILADDLLRNELSCYGGENITTKNIDKLAKEGMLFTSNYASEAISAPVRASLYTGLYPARSGTYYNHRKAYNTTKAVNDFMPQLGYRVGRVGKQHAAPESVYKFNELGGFPTNCNAAKSEPINTSPIEKFMAEGDSPFLLYVCSITPHHPWTLGDASKYDPNKIKLPKFLIDNKKTREIYTTYLAEIMALDEEVGTVRAAIKKAGKEDNTIIMFLGENGYGFPGGKWTCWNPGVQSAMIVHYPEKIKAGKKTDAIVQYEDVLPTLIDFAGGKVQSELDGKSFKDVLLGKSKKHRDWAYFIYNNQPEGEPYSIRGIRGDKYTLLVNYNYQTQYTNMHIIGDENRKPKLYWTAWEEGAKESEANQKLYDRFLTRPEYELYDNKKDPDELNNLAQDAKYDQIKQTMLEELKKWMIQQNDTGDKFDVATPKKKLSAKAKARLQNLPQ